jgi:hypothetical protein
MNPLIHILIRTHRPDMFARCMKSVNECGYNPISVMVIDGTGYGSNYRYNELCNTMKEDVDTGWFFFLDDDDVIIPGALSKISEHLIGTTPVIVQMLRNGTPKPSIDIIRPGHIGLPCMILHHSHKNVADVVARACGDYDWIKAVTDKLSYKWVPVPLVDAGLRSHGQ